MYGCEIEEFSGDEAWKIPVYTLLNPPSCNPVFPPGLPRSEEQRFCCHLQFKSCRDIGMEWHHLCGSHPLQGFLSKGKLHHNLKEGAEGEHTAGTSTARCNHAERFHRIRHLWTHQFILGEVPATACADRSSQGPCQLSGQSQGGDLPA